MVQAEARQDSESDIGLSGDELAALGNLLWIVDLNRQSLDRVIPGIRIQRFEAFFRSSGWQALEMKYGRRLQAAFARPGGQALRRRLDEMSNEEYQALIRLPGAIARQGLLGSGPQADAVARSVAEVSDEHSDRGRIAVDSTNSGGHP